MATFFYSHNMGQCLESQHLSIAGKVDVFLSDEAVSEGRGTAGELDGGRQAFMQLMEQIGSGDTLIVPRLGDLGQSSADINETIKLLRDRIVRVVVLQLGDVDLMQPENRTACRLLDAIAELECKPHPDRKPRTARTRNRSDTRLERETVVTQYSLGESIASLARRYNVPRSRIEKIVCPKRPSESLLPPGFGD